MKNSLKSILFLLMCFVFVGKMHSQETDFIIHTDTKTGGIQKIMNADDKYKMNELLEWK